MTSTPNTNSPCRSASGLPDVTPVPMSLPEPLRGEVWDVDFHELGCHPAVVLSIHVLDSRIGHVAVIPVTGARGPDQTHVALDRNAGLTRYDESYADVTALQPVARTRLLRRRGLLATAEIDRLTGQLAIYLGLPLAPGGRR